MKVLRFALVGFLVLGLVGCGSSPTTKRDEKKDTAGKSDDHKETAGKGDDHKETAGKGDDKTEHSTHDKLVGTWEVSKGEMPPGSTVQFTKDGKMKVTMKAGDKTVLAEGTYEVEGMSIKTTQKQGAKEVKETLKIKSLTDKELVTLDEKGMTDEFKKK